MFNSRCETCILILDKGFRTTMDFTFYHNKKYILNFLRAEEFSRALVKLHALVKKKFFTIHVTHEKNF